MSKRARTHRPPPTNGAPTTAASRPRSRRQDQRRESAGGLRKWVFPSIFLVAGLSAVGILVLAVTGSPAASDVKATRPVLGAPTAALVIHEYGDFQCPSCGAFARSIEPQIRAAYIDTGKVRLAWHDFAWIGSESRDAANAARCAGDQDKFWEFHDLLYRNQSGENAGAFSKQRLKAFGNDLGLETTAFNACVDAEKYANAVQADVNDVRTKGFNGTPTFVIGDQRIVGAQPFGVFAAAIDAALAKQ